jgi:ubiquinone/menaquinone biosynthesis C-methylase UbiE
MPEAVTPLTRELLAWISERPRTYGEAMAAWQTNCPRHPVWEDALNAGFIQVVEGQGPVGRSAVTLTDLGDAILAQESTEVRMKESVKDTNAQFAGSIPALYDKHKGPVIFEPYAENLVGRVTVPKGGRVLEVACGTGIVTQRLRARLDAGVHIVATDLNEDMIDCAKQKLASATGIEWRQADASALPFGDGEFDAVVCQFGIMFVPDKQAAMREARRVLKPGGTFLFNVWGTFSQNPFARIAHETIASFFPKDPPNFYLVPFGFNDRPTIQRMLEEAGFEAVKVDDVQLKGKSVSAADFAIGLVEGSPVSLAIRDRGVTAMAPIEAAVAKALARELGDRPVRVPMLAIVVTAK